MAGANPNFDIIASATLRNYSPNLIENILGHNVLLWKLQERGFRSKEKGGTSLTHPILYGTNSTAGSYSGYDVLDVSPQEGITTVELAWKQSAVSISISGKEEAENSAGKTRIFDLLEAKTKQAELSLRLDMNEQLWSDGSGNDSKDITGLNLAVEDGTAWSTYGGIDSSTYTWWRNQFLDKNAAFAATDGETVAGVAGMIRMFNSCTRGNSKPDLIITTQDLYEAYEKHIEPKERKTDTRLGDVGFMNIQFKGVPMVFDEDCPAETMFFLNSEFIKLYAHTGRNFITTDFKRPENQDAKVAQILWMGNLVVFKRDQQGRLTGLSV